MCSVPYHLFSTFSAKPGSVRFPFASSRGISLIISCCISIYLLIILMSFPAKGRWTNSPKMREAI